MVAEMEPEQRRRIAEVLVTVRPLAAEFYRLTGRPLGVTGEVAEQVTADLLGLTLAGARTVGYDATRPGKNPSGSRSRRTPIQRGGTRRQDRAVWQS